MKPRTKNNISKNLRFSFLSYCDESFSFLQRFINFNVKGVPLFKINHVVQKELLLGCVFVENKTFVPVVDLHTIFQAIISKVP